MKVNRAQSIVKVITYYPALWYEIEIQKSKVKSQKLKNGCQCCIDS